MTSIRPLHLHRCHRISIGELPTTFVESLSYYECLICIIEKVNDLIFAFNNILEQKIDEYLNNILMDAMYEEETETLVFYLTERSA